MSMRPNDTNLQQISIQTQRTDVLHQSAFRFKAPNHFLEQIDWQDPMDPLLLQVLPLKKEQNFTAGYSEDPVGDFKKNPSPSLIHKYKGRVLLIASPKCDIHCRYCFRRHFPYEAHANQRHWQTALNKIAEDKTIKEVILSGGDPMSMNEPTLLKLCQQIEDIAHIQTLRIHSRTPIVAPSKAPQNEWLQWNEHSRLSRVLVVHCNHANELSSETAELMKKYRQAGITLLNQSVLLKDINDCPKRLIDLSHALFQQGILPYYLHQLDKVEGAAHFEVNEEKAQHIITQIRAELPGYLVPKLVREISEEPNKTPL